MHGATGQKVGQLQFPGRIGHGRVVGAVEHYANAGRGGAVALDHLQPERAERPVPSSAVGPDRVRDLRVRNGW